MTAVVVLSATRALVRIIVDQTPIVQASQTVQVVAPIVKSTTTHHTV